MDRLACVDVPELALQQALIAHPEWASLPVVVVDEDKPQGHVLSANRAAREAGVLPGLRYAAALSLSHTLRAEPLNTGRLTDIAKAIGRDLQRFSPCVEVSSELGVFFLDASGLGGLYPHLLRYGEEIRALLLQRQLFSGCVIGFNRFFSYAIARASQGNALMVFDRAEREAQVASTIPITKIFASRDTRDFLAKLGIVTVGELARLPASGIKRRFPKDIVRVHEMAKGTIALPIASTDLPAPLSLRIHFDDAVGDSNQLLFLLSPLLDSVLKKLAERVEALAMLSLALTIYRTREVIVHELRPAAPTLDARSLLSLVRLRLQSVPVSAGITSVLLGATGVRTSADQLALLQAKPKRCALEARRVLFSLKALFGEDAVVTAQLRNAHLPGGRFVWVEANEVPIAKPSRSKDLSLVRRFRKTPDALPHRPNHEPDGWLLRGVEHGPVVKLSGPYVLAGGWWRKEVHRTFYFAEMSDGAVLWIFYDRSQRRWFLEGEVS